MDRWMDDGGWITMDGWTRNGIQYLKSNLNLNLKYDCHNVSTFKIENRERGVCFQ